MMVDDDSYLFHTCVGTYVRSWKYFCTVLVLFCGIGSSVYSTTSCGIKIHVINQSCCCVHEVQNVFPFSLLMLSCETPSPGQCGIDTPRPPSLSAAEPEYNGERQVEVEAIAAAVKTMMS